MRIRWHAVALSLVLAWTATARAGTVYSSIPSPKPPSVQSLGFEAQQTSEFGGLVQLGADGGPSPTVTVLMSSFACESGNWNGPTLCATTPGATFSVPITLRVYSRGAGDAPGAVLATQTKVFAIPYRPSAHPACGIRWSPDGVNCFNGYGTPITFDPLGVTLPSDVIVTVAYNTTHYGYSPIGQAAACFATPQGCGYDSLNVGLTSPVAVGAQPRPDDAYFASPAAGQYCDGGAGGVGMLRLDVPSGAGTPCWTGLQPDICIETVAAGCPAVLAAYVPPTVTSPVAGGLYGVGQAVPATFTCTADTGLTVSACQTAAGAASGASNLDTSSAGTKTFSVTVTDSLGQSRTVSFTYTVVGPPSVTITAPASGGVLSVGDAASAMFACQAQAPATVVSCVDGSGRNSGAALDTATAGAKTLTVTVTDSAGQTRTASVSFTVVAVQVAVKVSVPRRVFAGKTFPIAITVTNTGVVQARGLILRVPVPAGVRLVGRASRTVTVRVGDLVPGARRIVIVRARVVGAITRVRVAGVRVNGVNAAAAGAQVAATVIRPPTVVVTG